MFRDRIKAFVRLPAKVLLPHPLNWRVHGTAQRERLAAVLREVGMAGALLVRELPDGLYQIIDGHLRADLMPDQEIPCLVLDVSEPEAEMLLATLDPLGAMAEADAEAQAQLLSQLDAEEAFLRALLDELAGRTADRAVELKQLPTDRPPALCWVLIAIPTVRFGEIAAAVESIAAVEGTILETTVADATPDPAPSPPDQNNHGLCKDRQRRRGRQAGPAAPLPPQVSRPRKRRPAAPRA